MTDVIVRPAKPEEFERVGELTLAAYQASSALEPESDYRKELADAGRRAAAGELLVAIDHEGAILGSVSMALPGSEFAEIAREGELEFRMLATAPDARRRGVGHALTCAVLDRAGELGCTRVVLCSRDVMVAAHRLYERLGFSRLPERDWQPGPGGLQLAFAVPVCRAPVD
ncbi:ribosomal protein S18 acetylase RimI-like enzyme [Tamaricihabitans halophyticus]|uniref:Ribosomal protein S18 acetylase RimI-like enzyme n=1 Tax=Tamaricihabitans halophyticus TaxID=1262583 RepID=A0A4R2QTM8_9PSEU|nr:GNAT family N-acetyltransferase [Tamaricihabitans halophyticus]TCP52088.1 ribosomal protein S18 acetylase RimI-like enzyme [Tamaricihabitans halophyticus]